MIQINQIRNISEPTQKLLNFSEIIVSQFHQWCRWEHPLWRHHQRSILQCIQIAHHQQRSEVFFTGKNRLLGTFIPTACSNVFIAAPTAVSSWITLRPFSNDLLFTMISRLSCFASSTLLIASSFTQRLLVLKYLKVFTDLKSSMCSFGTWAISRRRSLSSYWMRVPPCERKINYSNYYW